MNPAIQRCHDRWYPLNEIPIYAELMAAVDNGIRFPLVPAGRRSGKTEKFKRFLAKQAMKNPNEKYFAGAPTRDQAKKIFWQDLKLLTFSPAFQRRPSESELIIYMPNGTEIHVVGLDKPERIEGTNWTGGGIDEIADIKASAVNENIMPALDTMHPNRPGYQSWCWFTGVPDGLNHYYDMCERAKSGQDKQSKVFHWVSADVLDPEVIAAAKSRLSKRQFQQEYEASFENATGRIYEDYNEDNYCTEAIQPHEQLLWYHDFNFTPLSSGIGVRRGNDVYLLEEIVLTSAVARQSAMEFVDRYKAHQNKRVVIYGDPSGRAGEKHGHESDYTEIESVLRSNGWTMERRVKPSTRSIKDGQNAVRAKIKTADGKISLYVNPLTAPYTHKALATGQLKKGSTFLEEDSEYQHIGTAIRYFIDYDFPIHEAMTRIKIGGM